MATYKYDANNIADEYGNQPIQPIFRFKLFSYIGDYTGQGTQVYYEGLVKCSFIFYENDDIKFVPKQRIKKFLNGQYFDGEEIEPYFIMKASGNASFNTGVSLVSLDSEPFVKIYGLPNNELHGLVNLMWGTTLISAPGKIDLMLHNFGKVEQRLDIGINIAMIY